LAVPGFKLSVSYLLGRNFPPPLIGITVQIFPKYVSSLQFWYLIPQQAHFEFSNLKGPGGGAVFLLPPLFEQAFSPLVITEVGLTGRHRIDRQTESGVRCVERLGGDAQPLLVLFLYPYFIYLFIFFVVSGIELRAS
jgi:hypothetical protein